MKAARLLLDAAGVGLVAYGTWLYSVPLGFVVGGVLLILASFALSKGSQS